MKKVRRAIISVTDKTGVVEFAKELSAAGVEIISTGGTAEMIKNAGVPVIPISSYTGFPEMLDGRLKTLHPKIHGGILGMRENPTHAKEMETNGILPIDMVVVDPADYGKIISEMKDKKGSLSKQTRFSLAKKVFQLTARYDAAISNYLGVVADIPEAEPMKAFPETYTVQFEKVQALRYGENPHQKAAFYRRRVRGKAGLADAKQLQGKELSYNNILDLNAALNLVAEFHEPAAVIVKHNNPCGTAVSKAGILKAYRLPAPGPP